jgi:hypothetical protein
VYAAVGVVPVVSSLPILSDFLHVCVFFLATRDSRG